MKNRLLQQDHCHQILLLHIGDYSCYKKLLLDIGGYPCYVNLLAVHNVPDQMYSFQGCKRGVANRINIVNKEGRLDSSMDGHVRSLGTNRKSISSQLIVSSSLSQLIGVVRIPQPCAFIFCTTSEYYPISSNSIVFSCIKLRLSNLVQNFS